MYNYNLADQPLEPPPEWDEEIYDFSDLPDYIPKKYRMGWGSCGRPWYDREDESDEYL